MVAREGLKADNKICGVVSGAFMHSKQIIKLKDDIIANRPYVHERDTVGMSIRRWDSQGGQWRLQALFALLVEAMNRNEPKSRRLHHNSTYCLLTDCVDYSGLFAEWQSFIDHLEQMEIMDAANLKGVLTGSELSAALGGLKPGAWMKAALDVCMEWQLRNMGVQDTKGAIEEVKMRAEELKIPIAR